MKNMRRVLLFSFLLIFLAGCGKKEEKEDITAVCKHLAKHEGDVTVTTTFTLKFNEENLLNYSESVIIEGNYDQETYNKKKLEYDELYSNNSSTDYTANDENRSFAFRTVLQNFNYEGYTLEEKKANEAGTYIKTYEDMGYSCDVEGTTRKELGLSE